MAELSINIHLNPSRERHLRSLDCTHDPVDTQNPVSSLLTAVQSAQLLGAQADDSSLTG